MPETIVNGKQYIELSKHNQLLAKSHQKYNLLYLKYYKSNLNVKILSKIYEDLKTNYPEQYWELTTKYAEDWAKIGRVLDFNEKVKEITERRDSGFCVKCKTESFMLKKGEVVATRLSIDHIFELNDGGRDELQNTQILCLECHRQKTRYFQYIRSKLKKDGKVFTSELAIKYNREWLSSKELVQ